MKILVATSNEHKKKELEALLEGHSLIMPSELGISFDCVENGTTFEENALIKAQALRNVDKDLDYPVLADDSGLLVDALPGLLGVKTARFGSVDDEHLLSADEKNKLLLSMLKDVPQKKRTARFCCNLVMIFQNGEIARACGIAEGRILFEPAGENGFGYDPVFFCNEAKSPMGELSNELKNRFSHRGKAARELLKLLRSDYERNSVKK